MVLLHHLPPSAGWSVEVVATDISTRVLEKAKRAIYSIEKAAEIPAPYLKKFMLKGTGEQEGTMKPDEDLQSVVRFQWLNLNAESYHPVQGRFDLIFCRNVLIYFNAQSRKRAVERLIGHLAPGGLLFVGHAESLHSVTQEVKSVIPTVYVHKREEGPRR